jgi:hypothetical protein
MLLKHTHICKNRSSLLPILLGLFYISILAQIEIEAQSNCPIQSLQTVGWVRSTTGVTPVKYFLQGSFNGQQSQITAAFTKWNQAMAATCLKVNFVPGAEGDYDFLVTYLTTDPTAGGISSNYPIPGVSGGLNINPNDFNTSLPSYSSVILKAALHEIGHTLGLDHPVGLQVPGGTVMNGRVNKDDTIPAPNGLVPTEIQLCDRTAINHNPQCPITYTRQPDLNGNFPTSVNNGIPQLVTHEMHISNYNAQTGTFTLKLVDYNRNKQTNQSPWVNSSTNPDPYMVVNNTDQCINKMDGSILNLSIVGPGTPVFGCSFTKQIPLTFVGTENLPPPNNGGNGGPFVRVYSGTTTPGSGVPYMYFIHTDPSGSPTPGLVHYASNAVIL